MTLFPYSRARAGKSLSTAEKQKFDIYGIFERKGRILAPAGMMWSVVILSPVFKDTLTAISSPRGTLTGKGLIFGPRFISKAAASFSGAGGITALSSILKEAGSVTASSPFKVRGSVI